MEKERKRKGSIANTSTALTSSSSVSNLQAFSVHLICAIALAISFWVTHNLYSIDLVSDPSRTLCVFWIVESLIAILLYSWFRLNPEQCSYLTAVGRGSLALPVGALLNAFGAIVLGAPVGFQYVMYWSMDPYLPKTIKLSLLMSSFAVVPAASAFGSSWSHWHRLFAYTKPSESLEYMICIPAHGALIGAWFGAWPMPLDWERPWQEWPICVTYGAIAGYLVALIVSLSFVLVQGGRWHLKGD